MRKQKTNTTQDPDQSIPLIQLMILGTHKIGTLLAVLGMVIGFNFAAQAQNSSVIVDMSVLDNNGRTFNTGNIGDIPAFSGNMMGGNLLMPGPVPPLSKYYGPTLSNDAMNAIKPLVSTFTSTTTASLISSDNVAAPDPEQLPEAPSVDMSEPVAVPTVPTVPEASTDSSDQAIALVPETVSEELPALPEPAAENAPEVAAESQETETASLSTGPLQLEPGRALQIIYNQPVADIPTASEDDLAAIASAIKANDNYRIQLMAYAGDNNLSSSKARRLSLSRALSVRSYFIGQGVRSTRIDVRALGDKTDEKPVNRVDINITER